MDIPGFSSYSLEKDGRVFNNKTKKFITKSHRAKTKFAFFKLKNDEGVWKQVSEQKLQALVYPPNPPDTFTKVPLYERTYISPEGEVWSGPTKVFPIGGMLSIQLREDGYPSVHTEKGLIAVHQLLALTYLDNLYLSKGLCVMHLDDDKNNYCLSNLKIGTYSENNKAAYETGANPGNGLKRN